MDLSDGINADTGQGKCVKLCLSGTENISKPIYLMHSSIFSILLSNERIKPNNF